MVKKLIFILTIFTSINSFGQTTLFSLKTIDFSKHEKWGPNQSNYSQFGVGYGFIVGSAEKYINIKDANATYITLNLRYKKKLNNVFAFGFDIFHNANTYQIKQINGKVFPDTLNHFKEYVNESDLGTGIFIRINFYHFNNSKRGNYLGNFIDLGISGSWVYSLYQSTTNKINMLKIKEITRGFDFFNKYYYSAFFRFGIDKTSIFLATRLSNLLKSTNTFPDLPPFSLGMEVSF